MPEAIVAGSGYSIRRAEPLAHLMVHCARHEARELSTRVGLPLGEHMLRAASWERWASLHLAPDEWLLIGPPTEAARVAQLFERESARVPLSWVDISDRSAALDLEGPGIADILASGCPLDLDEISFPAGGCSRSLFGKAPVMLWRTNGRSSFRMEYGRSFDVYVTRLLRACAADLDALAS